MVYYPQNWKEMAFYLTLPPVGDRSSPLHAGIFLPSRLASLILNFEDQKFGM
jgi:hypothetical protein